MVAGEQVLSFGLCTRRTATTLYLVDDFSEHLIVARLQQQRGSTV